MGHVDFKEENTFAAFAGYCLALRRRVRRKPGLLARIRGITGPEGRLLPLTQELQVVPLLGVTARLKNLRHPPGIPTVIAAMPISAPVLPT